MDFRGGFRKSRTDKRVTPLFSNISDASCTKLSDSWGCNRCLGVAVNTTWCSNFGCYQHHSFNNSCAHLCDVPRYTVLTEVGQCSAGRSGAVALVAAFILLILCPLCIIGTCIYIIALKCRAKSKVYLLSSTEAHEFSNFHNQSIPVSTTAIPVSAHVVNIPTTDAVFISSDENIELNAMPIIQSVAFDSLNTTFNLYR